MSHDPLCGQYCDGQPPKCRGGDCTLCDEVDCSCDLIAKVREDEQALAQKRVNLTIAAWSEQIEPTKIAARRVALRDAVEAVKSLLTYREYSWGIDGADDSGDYILLGQAVSAVEALVGER